MLKSHLKLALRSLLKDRLFSVIKLTGLTVGLVSSLLIALYVRHELTYDAFHEKADRIARVTMEYGMKGQPERAAVTGTKVAPALRQAFPEVEMAVRVFERPRVVRYEGKEPREESRFYFADSSFFEMFSFPLLAGDARTVLDDPFSVVLTAATAERYFNDENPVGKVLRVEDEAEYTITGVMQDPPANSQMKPDLIASFHSLPVAQPDRETWWSANFATYLLLREPADAARLESKIPAYMQARRDQTGVTGDNYLTFGIEPLLDVHLHSDVGSNFEPGGDVRYVYILGVVGLLILIIGASIYINLSIAASTKRARQVGVQKVLGATPGRLFRQHLTEAVVVCGTALLLSLPITAMLTPVIGGLFGRSLEAAALFDPLSIVFLVLFGASVAVLSGAYPALVLSRLQPSRVLKGSFSLSASGIWLRKALVVVQFSISVGLIICTLIVQDQLAFVQSKNLGYERDHVVVLRMDRQTIERVDLLRSEFQQSPHVKSVSVAYETPTHIQGGYGIAPSVTSEARTPVTALPADEHFLETFDIDLVAGRGLSESDVQLSRRMQEGLDTTSLLPILINASQARALGWTPDDALGRHVRFQGPSEIRGVVEDFHFASLHEPIGNLVIFPSPFGNSLMVKLDGTDLASTLAFMEDRWREVAPHRPFSYHFLDEEFNEMYGAEIRTARVAGAFSGMAVVLACLGLFGLASYIINQRTKEIGIRKVLGASLPNLIGVLAADFLKLVFVAFAVAMPVAYVSMQHWLEDFAYRTDMSWWIFAATGTGAVLIAMATVSYQAVSTALARPVKSLRYD